MAYKQTYNPCDDCQYSFSRNNQESNVCKICEFRQLFDKPTADVVPKSEVLTMQKEQLEKLKEVRFEVERLQKALDVYEETSGLKQAKAEVAREIIGIIDKRMELKIEQCKGVHNEIVLSVYRGQHDAYRDIKEIIEQKYGGKNG